jgi:hypothetical protein
VSRSTPSTRPPPTQRSTPYNEDESRTKAFHFALAASICAWLFFRASATVFAGGFGMNFGSGCIGLLATYSTPFACQPLNVSKRHRALRKNERFRM